MDEIEATRVVENVEYAVLLLSSQGESLVENLTKAAAEALAVHHNSSFALFDDDSVTARVITRRVKTTTEYGAWN